MLFLTLLLKGFIIGIAFIIPGVSGGTLAIYLGVYDQLLHSIGNIFKEFKKSVAFLLPIFLGIAISVVGLAKLLGFFIEKNSFITLCFFIGLILGGIPSITSKVNWKKKDLSGAISMAVAAGLVVFLLISKIAFSGAGVTGFDMNIGNFILLVFLGFIASATMIIPGISGSALLMVLGFYTAIVTNVIGNILDFSQIAYHLYVLLPFAVGAALGIIVFSRLIEYFLRKFSSQTYKAILGFIVASAIVIFFEIKDPASATLFENQTPIYVSLGSFLITHWVSTILGIFTLVIGVYASKTLVALEGKLKNRAE